MTPDLIFLTIATKNTESAACLLIDSLRAFGGELAKALFWVFTEHLEAIHSFEDEHTHQFPLKVTTQAAAYPLGKKVAACAQAEELASTGTGALVWMDPFCLVVQPPVLFDLGMEFDAAFRPVHIRNVGLLPSEPLDAFWKGIYTALGLKDIATTVTSFVDGQCLRTYFNTHAFAVNPALGLMRCWDEHFQKFVGDKQFQAAACSDEIHQVFLFQALLSTLVASRLEPAQVRILPPNYNYPYNLHQQVPDDRRVAALNELVCFAYEERDISPDAVSDVRIHEPLRSWLKNR